MREDPTLPKFEMTDDVRLTLSRTHWALYLRAYENVNRLIANFNERTSRVRWSMHADPPNEVKDKLLFVVNTYDDIMRHHLKEYLQQCHSVLEEEVKLKARDGVDIREFSTRQLNIIHDYWKGHLNWYEVMKERIGEINRKISSSPPRGNR